MSEDFETVVNHKTHLERKDEEPKKYAIVFINDDYTPMDFVIALLTQVLHHPMDIAEALMMEVHNSGQTVVKIYPKDIAETKTAMINNIAQEHQHPLKAVTQPINT